MAHAREVSGKIENIKDDLKQEEDTLKSLAESIRDFYEVVKDINISWVVCPSCGYIKIIEPGESQSHNCYYHKDIRMVKLSDLLDEQGNIKEP